MKSVYLFIIGLLVAIVSAVIGNVFSNPYPCSVSGIGCESVWESLSDNVVSYLSLFGVIAGIGTCFYSIYHA